MRAAKYLLAGVRNRDFVCNWYRNIFDMERDAKLLESESYTTRAWRCDIEREQLW